MSDLIRFFSEDVDFELPLPESAAQWLASVIEAEQSTPGEISIVFCSDPYLHNMNVQFLDHDTLTDVITFPYDDDPVSGDIFISIDRTADNAAGYGVSHLDETHRVMVHGVLHLLGYEDETPELKAAMRAKEDLYLARRSS